MGTRGVFSLNRVIQKRYINDWVNLSNVWIDQVPNTGYFGGGGPGPISSIDKTNYSSDTTVAVPSVNLSVARRELGATGNSTVGYFGGGFPGPLSTMDKVTYSSDTTEPVPTAALSASRYGVAATGNLTAGYFGGGNVASFPGLRTIMDKLIYSSDTITPLPSTGSLSAARQNLAATGNSTAGYFGGGSPTSSLVDKLIYSSDTTTPLPSTGSLSAARSSLAATGNSTAGYFGGGSGRSSTIDKVTYSTDTTGAVPGAQLSLPNSGLSATGNSTSGYFSGGISNLLNPSFGTIQLSIMDKINYSTDTLIRSVSSSLSSPRNFHAASSARANSLPGTWRRFSDGSTTTNPASLPPATPTPQTINLQIPDTGYFGGGQVSGPAFSTIDKLIYSSETTAALPNTFLYDNIANVSATGSSSAGYFGGGSPGTRTTITKITYSSDTSSIDPINLLTFGGYSTAATGNSSLGFFAGGRDVSLIRSTITRLTYSVDTTQTSVGGQLITARHALAASTSSTIGYFGGGFTSASPSLTSIMERFVYASDTVFATPTGPLSIARGSLAATGSSTAGYFGAGDSAVFPTYSTLDKITYSTNTTAPVPTTTLSSRGGLAATGNSTTGYFGGGSSYTSEMHKVTYTTDTSAPVPGASLSFARGNLGASSAKANLLPQSGTYSVPVFV